MRETSAPVLPIVENEGVAGFLIGEARDRRFVAVDRRFTLLDGSRFPRVDIARDAVRRLARVVQSEPLRP
jgi:hypothetical protein